MTKVWTYLRDIAVNIVFMFFLFYLAYGINGTKSWNYQDVVTRAFNPRAEDPNSVCFDNIGRVEDFYKWATEVMAPALRVSTYYNGDQAYYLAGFLNDFSSRLLGYATLRQVSDSLQLWSDTIVINNAKIRLIKNKFKKIKTNNKAMIL